MRLLAWNLNHRAARRRIPDWVAAAIAAQRPDVLVLTEYVQGPDHERFLAALLGQGLAHSALSECPARQNQVLIAAREALRHGGLKASPIHPAVPSNALHVVLERSGVDVLGFRMPAFSKREDRPRKRETWEWLLRAAAELRDGPAVIAGDFNTAPGDSAAYCGDCLEELVRSGWRHTRPASGHSWKHSRSGTDRQIDHVFLSPALAGGRAEYTWAFQTLATQAASGKAGLPDHAMVVAEIERGPARLELNGREDR